ncbi:MerR family transcriptional regulator [Rhodococcus qingshengii]|uniref:MerR family transcriptional regulator n=1 Tax=Rhodococcus qingshengii TaxID=334542 RepID=UPI0030BA03F2
MAETPWPGRDLGDIGALRIHRRHAATYEQYGLITPARTRGGTRRYNDEDLTRLGRITELIADGINLVGIKRVLELEDSTALLRRDNTRLRADNAHLRRKNTHDTEKRP